MQARRLRYILCVWLLWEQDAPGALVFAGGVEGVAERVGFEPTVPLGGTTAFEAAAFNHSATSPRGCREGYV